MKAFTLAAALLPLAACGTVGPHGGTAASFMNPTGISTGAGGAGAMGQPSGRTYGTDTQ